AAGMKRSGETRPCAGIFFRAQPVARHLARAAMDRQHPIAWRFTHHLVSLEVSLLRCPRYRRHKPQGKPAMSLRPWRDIIRRKSRQIMVGNVPV
ncbi:hypothetical protein ABI060_14215, partial [Enterococcus faecium]|uniref:hypothetical protein n=1 Tax=Enterococcus faecium TaxID=1352 RepID=UPI003F42C4FD